MPAVAWEPAADPLRALALQGELDIFSAPAVGLLLDAALASSLRPLVVDLAEVTFMDCAGMRPLLAARRRLGEDLQLCNVPPRVERLFRLAGVHGFLVGARVTPLPLGLPGGGDRARRGGATPPPGM